MQIQRAWSDRQDHPQVSVLRDDDSIVEIQWDGITPDAVSLRAWVAAGGSIEFIPPPPPPLPELPQPDPIATALERADAALFEAIVQALKDNPAVADALAARDALKDDA